MKRHCEKRLSSVAGPSIRPLGGLVGRELDEAVGVGDDRIALLLP